MRKAIVALSLLALFASCKKKENTCECTDGNDNIVFKKIINSKLNYSERLSYCADAERLNKQVATGVTCKVREATPKDESTQVE